jgi:hypothetical protein
MGQPTFSSILAIKTVERMTPGSYAVTVRAISPLGGGLIKTATISLVVNKPPEKDFKIMISPSTRSIPQGESAEFTVTVLSVNDFKDEVALSAAGLPSGASESFHPPVGTAIFSSILRIDVGASTPPGIFTITIIGEGGGKSHSTSCTLIIEEIPAVTTRMETATQTVEVETHATQTGILQAFKGMLTGYNPLVSLRLGRGYSGIGCSLDHEPEEDPAQNPQGILLHRVRSKDPGRGQVLPELRS